MPALIGVRSQSKLAAYMGAKAVAQNARQQLGAAKTGPEDVLGQFRVKQRHNTNKMLYFIHNREQSRVARALPACVGQLVDGCFNLVESVVWR